MDPLVAAIEDNDLATAKILLNDPAVANRLNNFCGKPPLAAARSREMANLSIEKGARVDLVSAWRSPRFGTLEVDTNVASYLVGPWRANCIAYAPKRPTGTVCKKTRSEVSPSRSRLRPFAIHSASFFRRRLRSCNNFPGCIVPTQTLGADGGADSGVASQIGRSGTGTRVAQTKSIRVSTTERTSSSCVGL